MRVQRMLIFLALLAPASAMAAETVVVRERDCRYLVRHEPAADVAYVPGRDVHGRPVAPADLPGAARIDAPRAVGVDLTIPLAAFLGPATPPRLGDAEVGTGTITVDLDDGRVLYNGQPLTDPETDRLIAACRDALPRQR